MKSVLKDELSQKEYLVRIHQYEIEITKVKILTLKKWIVCECLPFSTVDSSRFVRSQRVLKFNIAVKTSFMIKKFVTEYYLSYKVRIKNVLSNIPGKISFCVDSWTDLHLNHFFGIAAHFNFNKKIQSVANSFELRHNLSGIEMFKIFKKELLEYELSHKVFSVTTDNVAKKTFLYRGFPSE